MTILEQATIGFEIILGFVVITFIFLIIWAIKEYTKMRKKICEA